jgi:hypothetical protein
MTKDKADVQPVLASQEEWLEKAMELADQLITGDWTNDILKDRDALRAHLARPQQGNDSGDAPGQDSVHSPACSGCKTTVGSEAVVPSEVRAILEAVHRELDEGDGRNAPGHAHRVPGVWDEDNGAKAGKPCAWCLTWSMFTQLLATTATPAKVVPTSGAHGQDKQDGSSPSLPQQGEKESGND